MKMLPADAAIRSPKTTEYHMPSTPNNTGSKSTDPSSKINVRKKDINADTIPLFSAVKKAELKIAIPVKKYEKEMILNACTETGTSCMASCRNKTENG